MIMYSVSSNEKSSSLLYISFSRASAPMNVGLYSFFEISLTATSCMICSVSIYPSKGRIQFKKSAILAGFLIVVENDSGLYSFSRSFAICSSPNLIISHQDFIRALLCVIMEANIIACNINNIVFFRPCIKYLVIHILVPDNI